MKISTKGRYAVMAMHDVATQPGNFPVSLANIALRQNISLRYLEQLFVRLRRAGVVKSIRGPGGGYLLARPSSQINLKQILQAVDESLSPVDCVEENIPVVCCDHIDTCVTRIIWQRLGSRIAEVLASITLEDLCQEGQRLQGAKTVSHSFAFNI